MVTKINPEATAADISNHPYFENVADLKLEKGEKSQVAYIEFKSPSDKIAALYAATVPTIAPYVPKVNLLGWQLTAGQNVYPHGPKDIIHVGGVPGSTTDAEIEAHEIFDKANEVYINRSSDETRPITIRACFDSPADAFATLGLFEEGRVVFGGETIHARLFEKQQKKKNFEGKPKFDSRKSESKFANQDSRPPRRSSSRRSTGQSREYGQDPMGSFAY